MPVEKPGPGDPSQDPVPPKQPDPVPDVPGNPKPGDKPIPPGPNDPTPTPEPDLPPAAQRALQEAAERKAAAEALDLPPELGGRDGPEPVRYGDWENKGIAVDF
ncbi:DUF1674 domain-containing protein [Roseobacter sp.]|uniref:DUF1674 domain-containing protein n=1 Tax=Roseobacter sp. TaxID=1907202 RepID=UPI0025EF477A|nr:DUF1674 domain-containing protein [Roseobacter sp.]